MAARQRVDQRAAVLVRVALDAPELARSVPVREACERIATRFLERVAGPLAPAAGARWAAGDPPCSAWLRSAAGAIGAPLWVAAALREELLDGWVHAQASEHGERGALLAVRTSAPPERARAYLAGLCARELAGGAGRDPLAATSIARRLGPGTELVRLARWSAGG